MKAAQKARKAGRILIDLDHHVHKAVEDDRKSKPVRIIGTISEISDQPQMRMLCGAVIFAGLLRADRRMLMAGARMLAAHELATAAKNAVKDRVDRKRPRSASTKHQKKPSPGQKSGKENTSFPSGHSAGAMAVASAFAAEYPEYSRPALLAAGAVAIAQIPRCAHYPTDVGAGLAIGAAANSSIGIVSRIIGGAVDLLFRRGVDRPTS